MHDDVNFLQLLLQYLKILLSCANYCLYYLNLVGINKFKYERKTKLDSGSSRKMVCYL